MARAFDSVENSSTSDSVFQQASLNYTPDYNRVQRSPLSVFSRTSELLPGVSLVDDQRSSTLKIVVHLADSSQRTITVDEAGAPIKVQNPDGTSWIKKDDRWFVQTKTGLQPDGAGVTMSLDSNFDLIVKNTNGEQQLYRTDGSSQFVIRSSEGMLLTVENQVNGAISTISNSDGTSYVHQHAGWIYKDKQGKSTKVGNVHLVDGAVVEDPLNKLNEKVLAPEADVSGASDVAGAKTNTGISVGDANKFFMTQFQNEKWNPDGPSRSEDCGPTSLAMFMLHSGKFPPGVNPGDTEKLIQGVRFAMTGAHGAAGTSDAQVVKGAQAAGIKASSISGMTAIDEALGKGQMVVAGGNPGAPGAYGNRLNNSEFSHYDGGHFILIVGRSGDGYLINDPLSRTGARIVTASEMRAYCWGEIRNGKNLPPSGVALG